MLDNVLTFNSHLPILPNTAQFASDLPTFTYVVFKNGEQHEVIHAKFLSINHFNECLYVWNSLADRLDDKSYHYEGLVGV